ncbi:hypothetical protein PoB_006905700 [Plakobranchus ocellatus]|uniref:Uncharacterized protein n=1 Tax=Plakobranchus ocellatus TaxID=259542 RepID=A0AAV4DE85_9GAST|nr:hypothetical protein PoB_006905700 [Plakobranchus ocellatus]
MAQGENIKNLDWASDFPRELFAKARRFWHPGISTNVVCAIRAFCGSVELSTNTGQRPADELDRNTQSLSTSVLLGQAHTGSSITNKLPGPGLNRTRYRPERAINRPRESN